MAIPLTQLRRLLNADEPDYATLARLGSKILPQLGQLTMDRDAYVAANAASLAGMIDHAGALDLLQRAARHPSATVRVAAAGALRRSRHPAAISLVDALLKDSDKGVRKFALKAAAGLPHAALSAKVQHLSRNDPVDANRVLAARVARGAGAGLV